MNGTQDQRKNRGTSLLENEEAMERMIERMIECGMQYNQSKEIGARVGVKLGLPDPKVPNLPISQASCQKLQSKNCFFYTDEKS